jgi:hypothetical protein
MENLKDCIKSGLHLSSCDDDGFCNHCGYQDNNEITLMETYRIYYVVYEGNEYEIWLHDDNRVYQVFGEPEGKNIDGLREYLLNNLE